MIEFLALNSLAMLLLGLGVLVLGYLLAGLSWVVVRAVRWSGLVRREIRDGQH